VTEKTPSRRKPVEVKPRRSALALELKYTLSAGDIGGQVKAAQDRLITLGFDGFKNDGRYGVLMSKAVRRFQASKGLTITGDINASTWEALFQKNETSIEEK
jgi:peptidoglycan hydrolase-like protein with peptidoglycan-binding domain